MMLQDELKAIGLQVDDLPYGISRFPGGEEVLFNRNFDPLWRRVDEGPPCRCGSNEILQGNGKDELLHRQPRGRRFAWTVNAALLSTQTLLDWRCPIGF